MSFGTDPPSSTGACRCCRVLTIDMAKPFLPCHHRFKNGKDHCYHNLFFTHDPDALPSWAGHSILTTSACVTPPAPLCLWWDYVWSVRTHIKVGSDGRVPIGTQRLRIPKAPQTKVLLSLHPTGHHSVLAAAPDPKQKPALLFTDRSH
jgi:hypothetical protein